MLSVPREFLHGRFFPVLVFIDSKDGEAKDLGSNI
jgi:hypothetical protein